MPKKRPFPENAREELRAALRNNGVSKSRARRAIEQPSLKRHYVRT
jgi:hypothetical protein